MHAVLLEGENLVIERPQRARGTLVGAVSAALALSLSIALAVRALGWPIFWASFLAYLGAIVLFLLATLFGFWAYACSSLRYLIDHSGLHIRWGPVQHFIPIDHIEKLMPGRGEQRPRVRGLSWWGYHIGRGVVQGLGEVLFFSTHRSPEEVVYLQTATATYGLSPQDPARFTAQVQRFQRGGRPRASEAVWRHPLAAHPLWSDRLAQGLALIGILLNVGLFGYLFTVYPGLSDRITIEFPPIGAVTALESKRELLKIPATALAVLGANLLAAILASHWRERAAAYLLLSGSIFLQVLFWVAAAIALFNA